MPQEGSGTGGVGVGVVGVEAFALLGRGRRIGGGLRDAVRSGATVVAWARA
jgi:hypothetical protein